MSSITPFSSPPQIVRLTNLASLFAGTSTTSLPTHIFNGNISTGLPRFEPSLPPMAYQGNILTGIPSSFLNNNMVYGLPPLLNLPSVLDPAELQKLLEEWKTKANSSVYLSGILSDERKKILIEWLHRLEKTKEFSLVKTALAGKVCEILPDVLNNKEFQELFFSHAASNNASCQDRAAMSFNEIYTSWKLLCNAEQLPDSVKLSMMTGLAKTLCLRKELQKLISKHATGERETVEIFLYYESTLSKRLQLVTAVENMTYADIGRRSWVDPAKLERDVNNNFFEELFDLPIFQKMLLENRYMKQKWERINSLYYDKLIKLGDCPQGDPNDVKVLDHQHRQAMVMVEWKKAKMDLAHQLYQPLKDSCDLM